MVSYYSNYKVTTTGSKEEGGDMIGVGGEYKGSKNGQLRTSVLSVPQDCSADGPSESCFGFSCCDTTCCLPG